MTLSEIQQSFYTRSFDADSIRWWLMGLGVIILLLLILFLIKTIRSRKVRYSPYGTIDDPKMIRNIVRSAFDQRRPFEVQVQMEHEQRRPTLRCAPDQLDTNSFTLEVNGLNSLSDHWLGREISVFFRIMVGKEFTYYTFASRIDGINLPWPGMCQITLPMPTSLENRQKRAFLRITPPHEYFPGAAVWYGDHFPKSELLSNIAEWPRPRLLYIPERMEQFRVVDLSAGGARIAVPGQVVKTYQLQFNTAEHLILLLDLFDPEQNRRLRYWTECRIQNVWVEHASRNVHLGLQFIAWARPRDTVAPGEQSPGIEWLKLSTSKEVEPVGNWIIRRHLEMFRENPLDY